MSRAGWMFCQFAVFVGLSFWLANGMHSNGENSADATGFGVFFAFIFTLVIFGVVNQIQNWLIRRRAKSLLKSGVGLPDEPDHGGYRSGRTRTITEDSSELLEISLGEKPRKISGPLP